MTDARRPVPRRPAAAPRLDRRGFGRGVAHGLAGIGLAATGLAGAGAARGAPSRRGLVLAAAAGGGPVRASLPGAGAPARVTMRPPAPLLLGYAGSRSRAGLERPRDAAILHVTSLDGGDEPGTLRWAARTDTDNHGRRFDGPAVVVFDVSGHIELAGDLLFDRPRRWFAGQTAPAAANGSGGIYVHGHRRRLRASHVVVEHLRFVDGSPVKHDHGAFDIGYAADRDLHDIVVRNCTFLWGVDETFSITPAFAGREVKRRVDHVSVIDCLFAEPAQLDGKRGYNAMLQRGAHRIEWARNAGFGARYRNPALKEYTSAAITNNLAYDIHYPSVGIFTQADWVGDYPELYPAGQTLTHVGNVEEAGPSWSSPATTFVHHYDIDTGALRYSGVRQYFADEWIAGAPASYPPRAGHRVLAAPPLWPRRGIMPHEDVAAHVRAHVGAWPGARSATEARIIATWQRGGPLAHDAVDRRGIADFPDRPIAATTGRPALPSAPFATAADGRTVIEDWLERRHLAVGGSPDHDLDKRLRFPAGGIVTVAADGTVTFEPEDMAAGTAGVVEVGRADGGVVTVTCRAD